jgi:predicted Zn-dependent protease
LASYFSFGRTQEEEADLLGQKYLGSSQYPSMAASEIWIHLMAEEDASAIGRKRKPRQSYNVGYFASHPASLKRATYLREGAKQIGDAGDPVRGGHRAAIAPHLPLMLADQIKSNDFGGTEYLLTQLAADGGWTGDLLFARAEMYRNRGNPRDLVSATAFYQGAIAAGNASPEVKRGLGLALLRSGQAAEGKAALSEYLRSRPDASDGKAITALIQN